MSSRIRITTPSRLHFGLSSLGHDKSHPQFGGVGMMVDVPAVQLEIEPAERFSIQGPLSQRAEKFVRRVSEQLHVPGLPNLAIRIIAAQRQHVGLGVGTQLGLAIAAGISEAVGTPWRDPLRLSLISGRGRRSAVGTYGFLLGGLIVDSGHLPSAPLGSLHSRLPFPLDWRIVLLISPETTGQSGEEEDLAMRQLPPVPRELTARLERLATDEIGSSLAREDFAAFSEAVYHYGRLAGECFAPVQGGPFAAGTTTELVEWLRSQGIAGVGQSSWGPTVFALLENSAAAVQLRQQVLDHPLFGQHQIEISSAANTGIRIASGDQLS